MKKSLIITVGACASLLAAGAHADTITIETPTGATEMGGNPVDAKAVFTTSADTLTITLTDLLVDPKTVAQNISDLFFKITSGQTAGTLSSSSGKERSVAGNGSFTDGSTVSTGWKLTAGSTFHLDGLNSADDVPAHTIIGLPDGSNIYGNANNSITGNGPHNPFLAGDVTFILNIPGLNVDSSIKDVQFSFGTASGNNVDGGGGGNVPAGGTTVLLLGAALSGLAMVRRKLS